jgi:hypothetical protein
MTTFNIIAGIASILGLIGTAIGFVSWLLERRARRQLEAEAKRKAWSQISKVTGLMTDLEKDLGKREGYDSILQAEGKLSFMLRDLIKDVCSAEAPVSVETIKAWRTVGKLASDWQERLALSLLLTDEIEPAGLQSLGQKYQNADELPEAHPCHAPLATDETNGGGPNPPMEPTGSARG